MKLVLTSICFAGLVILSATASAERPGALIADPLPACPAPDPVAHSAADAALHLMIALGPQGADVLSPSLYRLSSSGRGIEFDPALPGVPERAKGLLEIAQRDDSVAEFLRRGQSLCEAYSQGFYPRFSQKALDVAATSPARPWCEGSLKSGTAVVSKGDANPFVTIGTPVARKFQPQSPRKECSAFFGPAQNRDFLLATLSSTARGEDVEYRLAMDPIPYTLSGPQYDVNNNQCGTKPNPYAIVITNQYADPSQANTWATRCVNGNQQWGQFSNEVQVTVNGIVFTV